MTPGIDLALSSAQPAPLWQLVVGRNSLFGILISPWLVYVIIFQTQFWQSSPGAHRNPKYFRSPYNWQIFTRVEGEPPGISSVNENLFFPPRCVPDSFHLLTGRRVILALISTQSVLQISSRHLISTFPSGHHLLLSLSQRNFFQFSFSTAFLLPPFNLPLCLDISLDGEETQERT